MSKKMKIQDLLEAHLDKIVLGVIGVLSLYLLWAFVLGNPYGVEAYGRKLGPGQIDQMNRQQAQLLAESLDTPADPIIYDLTISADFEELMRTSLPTLAVHLSIPYPGVGEQVFENDRVYPIPEIVPLSEVQVAFLRGAVHKPTEEVTPEMPYRNVMTELGDLDLVSVSGIIDIQTLYRNFQQSFMGPRLAATWREPAYAKPVFARMELQRRQKLADGAWGDWQALPRTQIDPFRKLLEQTPMTTEQMEYGGVMLWVKQYDDPRVQFNLLQPEPYDFASTLTAWLPPKYQDEAQTIIKRDEEELRRKLREERQAARTTRDDPAGAGRQPTRPQPTRPQPTRPRPRGGREASPEMMMDPMMMTPQPQRPAAAARRERTLDDILKDMQKERITDQTKLDSLRDPLLVWAHDDTAKPGETYQYRIRLGVFNPIAGREWFSEDQKQFKNQVVLWSSFSEPTNEVEIPRMMQLFPTEALAKDAAGGVKVDVARYFLGQWRTHEFEVFPGQVIGESVEHTPPAADATMAGRGPMNEMMMMDPFGGAGAGAGAARGAGMVASVPTTVDFTTPYMLVDVNTRVEWGSSFNRSEYSQMLYYGPEQSMLAMGIGKNNWTPKMRNEYAEIKDAEQNAIPLDPTRSSQPGMMPTPGRGNPAEPPMMMPEFMM